MDYAGKINDEIGITIQNWSPSQVMFYIGSPMKTYSLGNPWAAGDSATVYVNGAYFYPVLPTL